MSEAVALSVRLFDVGRRPAATDVAEFAPVFPDLTGVGVEGLGLADDGVIVPAPVHVAAGEDGVVVVALIPSAQTRAPAQGEPGTRVRMTLAPGQTIEFSPPARADWLHDIAGRDTAGAPPDTAGAQLPALPIDGRTYHLAGRHPPAGSAIEWWAAPLLVPSTPGTQSGIGRVLTVTGEDDADYAWRDPHGAGGSGEDSTARAAAAAAQGAADAAGRAATAAQATADQARLDAEAAATAAATATTVAEAAKREADTASGTVDTARTAADAATAAARDATAAARTATDTAAAAKATADTAAADAAAAQLDAGTVITVGPAFVVDEPGPRNLNVAIRHPLGAYGRARLMSVSAAGQPAVLVGYDPARLHQSVRAELSAVAVGNIWDLTDRNVGPPHPRVYTTGSHVPVDIRLLTGRGGSTVFLRTIDVPVVAAPAAAAALAAAEAAQLAADTRIEVGPNLNSRRASQAATIFVTVRRPPGGYPGATVVGVSVEGLTEVRQPFDPQLAVSNHRVALTAQQMRSIASHVTAGNFVEVRVRLWPAQGAALLDRTVDLRVG